MIAGYIGCPECGKVWYAIDAVEMKLPDDPLTHSGHFTNELTFLGSGQAPADYTVCPIDGAQLQRVSQETQHDRTSSGGNQAADATGNSEAGR